MAMTYTTGTSGGGGGGFSENIAKRVAQITSENSPLMKQARTTGLQQANQRGLSNSSMAVGASQAEAIRTAAPIASQEATLVSQRERQEADLAEQQRAQAATIAAQKYQQEQDIAAKDREAQLAALTRLSGDRMTAYATALSNPELPADARISTLRSFNDQYSQTANYLQNLYGVRLDQNAPGPPGGAPGVPGMPGAPSSGANTTYAAYVQNNPDLMREFQRVQGEFNGDIAAFGRFHYERYGRNEGRQLPSMGLGAAAPAQPAAPVAAPAPRAPIRTPTPVPPVRRPAPLPSPSAPPIMGGGYTLPGNFSLNQIRGLGLV